MQHNSTLIQTDAMQGFHTRWLKAQDVDSEFREAWLHLFDSHPSATFIHHPDWLLAANSYLLSNTLRLGLVSDANGNPVMLLPLCSEENALQANLPRHDHLSLSDALIPPSLQGDTVTQALYAALEASGPRWSSFNGLNIPDTSALVAAGKHSATQWLHRTGRQSAWFDCSTAPAIPGKLRRNLNRLRKQLMAKETLETRLVEGDGLQQAYADFLHLEKKGWKGQGESTAIADSASLKDFYQQLLTPQHGSMQPAIHLLIANDKPIAAQFAMRTRQTLSLLKVAYDEDYAHYSPGSLLLQDVMDSINELPVNTLSLVTSPVWAERWHPQITATWHISYYRRNLVGFGSQLVTQARTSLARQIRAVSTRKSL